MNVTRLAAALGLFVTLGACGGAGTPAPEAAHPSSAGSAASGATKGKDDATSDHKAMGAPASRGEEDAQGAGPARVAADGHGEAPPGLDGREPQEPSAPLADAIAMPTPAAYKSGQVLAYLPKDCKERIFVNVGSMVSRDAAANIGAVLHQIIAMKARDKAAAVEKGMKVAHDGGFDPFVQVREIAVCGDVVAVGLQLDRGVDIAATLQHALAAMGDRVGAVVREGALSILRKGDGGALAQVDGNVLVVADEESELRPAIAAKAGAAGFGNVARALVLVRGDEFALDVLGGGANLDVSVAVHLSDGDAKEAQANPKEFTAAITQGLTQIADRLSATPAKPIGERLRALKPQLRGKDIVLQGTVPLTELQAVLKSVSGMKPEDIIRMLPH